VPNLSNQSPDRIPPSAPPSEVTVRPARTSEIDACIPYLISGNNRPATDDMVRQFRQFVTLRSLRLDRMLVAQVGNRLVWYILPIPSPGRTTMFMLPGAGPPSESSPAADLLLDAAFVDARAEGIHLAQVLLDPSDIPNRELLKRNGFISLAELIYLQIIPHRPVAMPAIPDNFALQRYSQSTHALFAAAILESYRDSLDCPGLAGMREIEDIILGHKAAGDFDPDTWFVLTENTIPAGVLLLSTVTGHDTTELVYIGLAPGARGRGLGHFLLELAMHATQAAKNRRLTLAVDSRNTPALKLYYTHGLQRIATKLAYVKDLRGS